MKANAKFFWFMMLAGAGIMSNLVLDITAGLWFFVPAFVFSILGYIFTVDR